MDQIFQLLAVKIGLALVNSACPKTPHFCWAEAPRDRIEIVTRGLDEQFLVSSTPKHAK